VTGASQHDVSRETDDLLDRFSALVARWTPRINLIAPSTLAQIGSRHIADSAQLLPLATPDWTHWADLGSGAGFPGIVIAILARHRSPSPRITLVESDQRKAAFLRAAVQDLGLSTRVQAERAETLAPLGADVLSARALAPLAGLLPLAQRHLALGGRALFPKGRRAEDEIATARTAWRFDLISHPSHTDPQARILQIEGISHV
jgi:16S rRNA (guanine527-N7)-methyltransferase